MIKKVMVVPLSFIVRCVLNEKSPFEEPWALVSICDSYPFIDSKKKELLKEKGCLDSLSMVFSDTTKEKYLNFPQSIKKDLILFNKKHAKEFLDFVKKVQESSDIKILVIHCTAGVSRSGALGVFACRWLKLDEKSFKKDNFNILPNPYILSFLMAKGGLNTNNYEDWWNDKQQISTTNLF